MDPVVAAAIVAGAAAIIGSLLTLRANRETERTKATASENTSAIEALKAQMAGWPPLVDSLRSELERVNESRDRTQRENEELRAVNGALRSELADCKEDLR